MSPDSHNGVGNNCVVELHLASRAAGGNVLRNGRPVLVLYHSDPLRMRGHPRNEPDKKGRAILTLLFGESPDYNSSETGPASGGHSYRRRSPLSRQMGKPSSTGRVNRY